MATNTAVAVFGAYGHTGHFVVAELLRRGWTPVLAGRDPQRLAALGQVFPALEQRVATVDDTASLLRLLDGVVAIINCAGPFLDTALPIIEVALAAGVHYLDVSAEQQTTLQVFERFGDTARRAGVTIMPAMGFYGGLADLLATAAMGDWADADRIDIAVALDSWHPTLGTRKTGARNLARRLVVRDGQLGFLADPAPTRQWTFPPPFGVQDMVALPLSEIITLSRHMQCLQVHSHMNLAPLKDLRDPATPAPLPVDASGRSAQRFVLEAVVQRGGQVRRASAQGRDIYAVTAPLVVEALRRIVERGERRHPQAGVLAPGAAFSAMEFLQSAGDLQLAFDDEAVYGF